MILPIRYFVFAVLPATFCLNQLLSFNLSMQFQEDLLQLQFIYVTTTGRKTGLAREIEIWFVEREGKFYILAEHFYKAHWVRNMQNDSRVQVRLGDKTFSATGRILDEKKDARLWQVTQHLSIEKYGWGDGLPVEITPDE